MREGGEGGCEGFYLADEFGVRFRAEVAVHGGLDCIEVLDGVFEEV